MLKKQFHNWKYTILHISIWGNKQKILPCFLFSLPFVLSCELSLVLVIFAEIFIVIVYKTYRMKLLPKAPTEVLESMCHRRVRVLSCGWSCPVFGPLLIWGQVDPSSVSLFLSPTLRRPTATNRGSGKCPRSWAPVLWAFLLFGGSWTRSRSVCYPPCSVTIWWALGSLLRGSAGQLVSPQALHWQHHLPSAQLQQSSWFFKQRSPGWVQRQPGCGALRQAAMASPW